MPSKLNYSKWDAIELSDDSDIEVHPNVDKKSFIRWKQQDIHQKREQRKQQIKNLHAELEMNKVMLPQIDSYIDATKSEGLPFAQRKVAELQASTDNSKPTGSTGPSYREMLLSLLLQMGEHVKELKDVDDAERVSKAVTFIQGHRDVMAKRSEDAPKEIAALEAEQKKHITSDDIHEGFDVGYVSTNANTAQPNESKGKGKVKAVDTNIETIHDPVASATSGPATSGYQSDVNEQALAERTAADEDIPDLTPAARQFIDIPIDKWEKLFVCISDHPELLNPKVVDSLLMEAFNAGGKGDAKRTMACVHQALLLQYCAKLGSDGVNLFFKRMSSNTQGRKVFRDDVQSTYDRIMKRSQELKAEHGSSQEGEEAIQLVATDENTQISFNVPSGPPPEHITLEGEGTEDLDIDEVKAFLDRQWSIFESFPKNFKTALEENSLDKVNTCLARMALDEAEETVKKLQEAGILSFSSTDIVDETGK